MAQDLSITLGLDDSQFLAEMNKSTATVVDFANKAKTQLQSVNDSIQNLGNAVENLGDKFSNLARLVIGVGLADFTARAIQSTTAMVDQAESLGISTQRFMELGLAVTAAGKNSNSLSAGLQHMENAAEQASKGNLKLIDAFAQVGVSMDYLRTHSPDETFVKIAQGLLAIENPAQRAAAAQEILGRQMRGLNLQTFLEQYGKFKGTQDDNAAAAEKVQKAMADLSTGITTLKNNVVTIVSNFTDLIGTDAKGLLGSKKAAELLITTLGLLTAGTIVKAINSIITGFTGLFTALIATKTSADSTTTSLQAFTEATIQSQISAAALAGSLQPLIVSYNEMTVAVERANVAQAAGLDASVQYSFLTKAAEATTKYNRELQSITTISKDVSNELKNVNSITQETQVAMNDTAIAATGLSGGLATVVGLVAGVFSPAMFVFVTAIKTVNGNLKTLGETFDYLKGKASDFIDYLDSKSSKLADSIRGMFGKVPKYYEKGGPFDPDSYGKENFGDINDQSKPGTVANTINPLDDQLKKLKEQYEQLLANNDASLDRLKLEISLVSATDDVRKSTLAQFDANRKNAQQISEINKQILEFQSKNKEFVATAPYKAFIDYLKQTKSTLEENNNEIEKATKLLQEQQDQQKYNNEMATLYLNNDLTVKKQIQDLDTQIQDQDKTADQLKLDAIQKQITQYQKLAIEKSHAESQGKGGLNVQSDKDIADQVAKQFDPLIDKTHEAIAISREFSTGWNKAFAQFQDDATNNAKLATTIFNTMTNGIQNALVQFVNTGKLSFKSLILALIDDLVMLQVKMAEIALFGKGTLFGNFFGSLFGTSAAVGSGTALGDNIAMSPGLTFAANGGDLSSGQPTVVGENGPELFIPSVPGSVMTNQSITNAMASGYASQPVQHNSITNNITALDSKSVAQMFVENRKQLLGTINMANRELQYASY